MASKVRRVPDCTGRRHLLVAAAEVACSPRRSIERRIWGTRVWIFRRMSCWRYRSSLSLILRSRLFSRFSSICKRMRSIRGPRIYRGRTRLWFWRDSLARTFNCLGTVRQPSKPTNSTRRTPCTSPQLSTWKRVSSVRRTCCSWR